MKAQALVILLIAAALAGCANNAPPAGSGSQGVPVSGTPAPTIEGLSANLLGDGSTFVAPLMDTWRTKFGQANSGVTISYTGGGSGKGRSDITNKLVDFAGSDTPMKDAELANASDVLHIPVAAGGVALGYNVPEVSGTALKFDGPLVADIFLGKVTKWNDPRIMALNPGVALPSDDIAVVHRSDGSGTTATFTDYLKKVSPAWAAGPGSGSSVNWPTGTGANGNAGVGSQLQQIPYSLGYIGSEWSEISHLATGLIKNKAGEYVAPTPAAVTAALDAGLESNAFDDKLRGSVTDMEGAESYPIAAVTWVLVHQHQADAAKGKALAAFLWYTLHEGQSENVPLSYARIPESLVTRAETFVNSMDAAGEPLR